MRKTKKIPQDIVGNIAVLKFGRRTPWLLKKWRARNFLRMTPNVTTVVEKIDKFSGRLRTPITKHLVGEKTKQVVYKENGLTFRFGLDETYFSPRLSHERKLTAEAVARRCRKNAKVLFMFAGVAPYPLVLAKVLREQKKFSVRIVVNELNRKANEYAKRNIYENKFGKIITLLPGDAKHLPEKVGRQTFDVIVMTRPHLKDTFLATALKLSKKGTIIFYHGFGTKEQVLNEIKRACGKKISRISIRKAGDIGKDVFRWLATFKVK